MRFYNDYLLHTIWIVVVVIIVLFYSQSRRLNTFKASFGVHATKLLGAWNTKRRTIKLILLGCSFVWIILTLARPQFGIRTEEAKIKGIDLIIAVDTSLSMQAEDIKPSRIVRARYELGRLIDLLPGNRIALVVFAGKAFLQSPLTTDYSALKMYLSIIDTDLITNQGTAISDAIDKTIEAFNNATLNKDEDGNNGIERVVILLTDGEDHLAKIEDSVARANKEKIRIYPIGIGSPEGAPIPIKDKQGNPIGFKKDRDGKTVISKLNDIVLQKIATSTGGKYFRAGSGGSDLKTILNEIAQIERTEIESKTITEYDDKYQWVLVVALLFLVLEFVIPEMSGRNTEWRGRV